MTSYAQAAQAIRKELKTAFPNIKFSVRSEGYSMGDNVNIGWIDGPTVKQVESIVKKYQEGHFDGMTDMYEYSNNRDDIPQTKYVFCNRKISDQLKTDILSKINKSYGLELTLENYSQTRIFESWGDQFVWRYINENNI